MAKMAQDRAKRAFKWITSVSIVVGTLVWSCGDGNISHFFVYLTYRSPDTSSTITINYFHTQKYFGETQVYYDVQPREGKLAEYQYHAQPGQNIPGGTKSLLGVGGLIHWIEIKNLQPNTVYYFVVGDDDNGYSAEKSFRTLPDDDTPIRFVTGGDIGPGFITEQVTAQASRFEPMVVLLGGDLAYGNGAATGIPLWYGLLRTFTNIMITNDNRLVPIIAAIGNHETNTKGGGPAQEVAPNYFAFLEQGSADHAYAVRKLGANSVVFVLDSGHVDQWDGPQLDWLNNQMEKYKAVPNKFALYHVPLYPSFRPFDGERSKKGRLHWQPIFDKYGVTAAFENHDHAFKRSKLLNAGKEVRTGGTLYLGDGDWGIEPRDLGPLRPYLDKAMERNHVWVVDIEGDRIDYMAIDKNGAVIDDFTQFGPGTPAVAYQSNHVATFIQRLFWNPYEWY